LGDRRPDHTCTLLSSINYRTSANVTDCRVEGYIAQIYDERSVSGDKAWGGIVPDSITLPAPLAWPSIRIIEESPVQRSRTCNYRLPESSQVERGSYVLVSEFIRLSYLLSCPDLKEIDENSSIPVSSKSWIPLSLRVNEKGVVTRGL
jgi:hypothetical protein